jgi:RHS repeat-associated protein
MEIQSANGSQRLLLSPTRLYDPADGRFLSRDPIRRTNCSGRIALPKPVYLYVVNTPLNMVDPDGRDYIVHPPNVTGAAYQAWWQWAASLRGGVL